LKSKVSPMFLTYFMMKWEDVRQEPSDHRCTDCGMPLNRTEKVEDEKGRGYEGYVCHRDKRVTWVRVG
jgi:ribosomal protein L34E